MRKRNPVRTETSGFRYQMRHRRRIAHDAIRPAIGPDLSKLQVILPVQSAERRLFRAAFSFKSAASFSQQIPKVICERSCRMAKTLIVNITPILKKESRKMKKNKKKMHFSIIFREKNVGKRRKYAFLRRQSMQRRYWMVCFEKKVKAGADAAAAAILEKFDFSRKKAYSILVIGLFFSKDGSIWR